MVTGGVYRNRYWLWALIVSVVVSHLIHTPEMIALAGSLDKHNVFPGIRFTEVAIEILFSFISLITLFFLSEAIFHLNSTRKNIGPGKLLLSFLFGWAFSAIMSNLFYLMHLKLGVPAVQTTAHHYLHPLRDFIISGTVTGSCYMLYLVRRQQQNTSEIQELRLENMRNQYEALKNQLNPHMLFNSLNTLRSLIRENPDKAQEYTQELSSVFRYMLQANDSRQVTLDEELEFVEAYIFLLKMRFEDNLDFRIEIDREYGSYFLPPMSLQLLVENAVKHNEVSSHRPLTITIANKDREIFVCNPLQSKLTASAGSKIGLSNLSKRFKLLYDREISIESSSGRFCVTLPLISPAEYESIDR